MNSVTGKRKINIFQQKLHSENLTYGRVSLKRIYSICWYIQVSIYNIFYLLYSGKRNFFTGPLPLGYSAIVKVKSEETHQIQHMGNEDNTEEVLMGLISKITEGGDSEKYPTIYVAEKEINMVQKILNQLCDKFGKNRLNFFITIKFLIT